MAWKNLSVHFKQTYEGGFRYLDRCGEFMLAATENLNFIAGEVKPTGAKMEIPEYGINLTCDANILGLSQELPPENDKYFLDLCNSSSAMVKELFTPTSILKNGFALKSYVSFPNVQALLEASLKIGKDSQNDFGKIVGMVPEHKKLDYFFVSGSKEFRLLVQPITFERANLTKQNIGSQLNRVDRSRIERRNTFAERISSNFAATHALMLDLDFMENDPPADASLEKHFTELMQKGEQLKKQLDSYL